MPHNHPIIQRANNLNPGGFELGKTLSKPIRSLGILLDQGLVGRGPDNFIRRITHCPIGLVSAKISVFAQVNVIMPTLSTSSKGGYENLSQRLAWSIFYFPDSDIYPLGKVNVPLKNWAKPQQLLKSKTSPLEIATFRWFTSTNVCAI